MDPTDAINRAFALFGQALQVQLKTLLEEKHLYQTVAIDVVAIAAQTIDRAYPDRRERLTQVFEAYISPSWNLDRPSRPDVPPIGPLPSGAHVPLVSFPTIKLFCEGCDRTEPYKVLTAVEATEAASPSKGKGTLQVFVVGYECQSTCTSAPEYVMIRREGVKLSLVGRTPMAHVEVPSSVPKSHRKFLVDAFRARNAGQVLPALFMLRTFVEQFASSQVNVPGLRADDILNRYMDMLPQPVRSHFASPRDVYARLSDAIHQAREDSLLFERSAAEIVEHFEARKLYKVSPPA
jgi:hypothetical protein